MVKPSSLGFLDVSIGAADAGRSATAVAAFTEDTDREAVALFPVQKIAYIQTSVLILLSPILQKRL